MPHEGKNLMSGSSEQPVEVGQCVCVPLDRRMASPRVGTYCSVGAFCQNVYFQLFICWTIEFSVVDGTPLQKVHAVLNLLYVKYYLEQNAGLSVTKPG